MLCRPPWGGASHGVGALLTVAPAAARLPDRLAARVQAHLLRLARLPAALVAHAHHLVEAPPGHRPVDLFEDLAWAVGLRDEEGAHAHGRLFSQLEVQAHRLVHVRDEPDPALPVVVADDALPLLHLLAQVPEGLLVVAPTDHVAVPEELRDEVALDAKRAASGSADGLVVEHLDV